MKVEINRDNRMKITAENELEVIALEKFAELGRNNIGNNIDIVLPAESELREKSFITK